MKIQRKVFLKTMKMKKNLTYKITITKRKKTMKILKKITNKKIFLMALYLLKKLVYNRPLLFLVSFAAILPFFL